MRRRTNFLVGVLGIEPSLHPPEGRVLPVYYTPLNLVWWRATAALIPVINPLFYPKFTFFRKLNFLFFFFDNFLAFLF